MRNLEQCGYEVLEAESVEGALQLLARWKVACVLAMADQTADGTPDLVAGSWATIRP
jgi:CheY-like chemotaxis protein